MTEAQITLTGETMHVCRYVAGDHTGGPGCFCSPTPVVLDGTKTADAIFYEVERMQRLV